MNDEYGEYEMVPVPVVRGGKPRLVKVYKEPRKHIMIASDGKPQGWYKGKHVEGRARPRTCYTEATLVAPYSGVCTSVNCRYCYLSTGTRGYKDAGMAIVDPDYPDKLAKSLSKMMISGPVYITPFHEPFSDLEPKYHNTQRVVEAVVKEGLPFFFTTKRVPPPWAMSALKQNPYSYIHFSINTCHADVYRRLSPGAADLYELYNSIAACASLGIFVAVQCNPLLPGIVWLDGVDMLTRNVYDQGAKHIIYKFVEVQPQAKSTMMSKIKDAGLSDCNIDWFEQQLSQYIGGVYTINQDTRLTWLTALLDITRELGMTMSTCHEYYQHEGDSIHQLGPHYNTSDACHGRGVPLYYRPEPGAPFQPLPGCYRKGCLYCEEYGTKACENAKLIHADALTYKDFCSIRLHGQDIDWGYVDSCERPDRAYIGGRNIRLVTDSELWGWDQE